jgi:hypothetical protein
MNSKDRDRFVKLMMLTQSDHDGEALVALRKANGLLVRDNQNWQEFIDGKTVTTVNNNVDDAGLEEMFEFLFDRVRGSFRLFIDDVHRQWVRKGSVSPKQYDAVLSAFRRHGGRRTV